MRWVKTCIRKNPRTYTIIKAPSVIDIEFIHWVNDNYTEVHLEVGVSGEVIVDSLADYDGGYHEVLPPNGYLIIDNYDGSFDIIKHKEILWNIYEEVQN